MIRVQHLLALHINGHSIKYILSWASEPFHHTHRHPIFLRDGNHPHWIAQSHKISMNLQIQDTKTTVWAQWKELRKSWAVVTIDIDNVPDRMPLFHQNFVFLDSNDRRHINRTNSSRRKDREQLMIYVKIVFKVGLGHPHVHSSNLFLISDAYPKEMDFLHEKFHQQLKQHSKDKIPLILVKLNRNDSHHLKPPLEVLHVRPTFPLKTIERKIVLKYDRILGL